ncbi:hypothetical protein [Arthrobacter sp. SD76]|uniref:hypothetical protein n=1 Tax=Arthrobacter sp. SD76 TaxID=3415007 RepID=UPI003C72134B
MTSQKTSLEPPGDMMDPATTELPEPPKHSRRTVLSSVAALAALGLATTVLGEGLLNPPSSTEDGDFSGETLEFLIPLASGGGTDTWARFIGTELTNYVQDAPGSRPSTNPAAKVSPAPTSSPVPPRPTAPRSWWGPHRPWCPGSWDALQ